MRIAFISDIHEDIISLSAIIKQIEKECCDEIICLGDCVGFNEIHYNYKNTRDANSCLFLLKKHCKVVIPGNHDLHAIKKTPELSNGFLFPENWYNLNTEEQTKLSNNKVWLYNDGELNAELIKANENWIKTLPEAQTFNTPAGNILLSHYIYPNICGSYKDHYTKTKDFAAHKKLMKKMNCTISFSGHVHYPGIIIINRRIRIRSFNKKHKVKKGSCIIIPPLAGNGNKNSFSIFDSEKLTIEAKLL